MARKYTRTVDPVLIYGQDFQSCCLTITLERISMRRGCQILVAPSSRCTKNYQTKLICNLGVVSVHLRYLTMLPRDSSSPEKFSMPSNPSLTNGIDFQKRKDRARGRQNVGFYNFIDPRCEISAT